jgi:parallel beta-helix repeat protein
MTKFPNNKIVFLTAVVFAVLLLPKLTQAATYYVDNSKTHGGNCSDSNSGTSWSSPFCTIQKAANIVSAGDTVLVATGTYVGTLIRNKNGTSGAHITFQAYSGDTVTIDPYKDNYSNCLNGFRFEGSSYIDVKGFLITDTNPYRLSQNYSEYSIGVSKDGVKITSSSSHIKIQNNEIKYSGQMGILISANNNYCEILNNNVHNVGWCKRGYGIYNEADYTTIRGNTFAYNYGYGIHNYSDTGTPNNTLIEKNLMHHNGHTDYGKGYCGFPSSCTTNCVATCVGTTRGAGIVSSSGYSNTIQNNVLFSNVSHGIMMSSDSSSMVYNNTFYGNDGYGISIPADRNDIIQNNIVYGNSSGQLSIGSGNTQDHNLTSDPKFKNASAADFNLLAGSPAINAGLTIAGVTDDFDGVSRPQGGSFDIGAYEYGGGTPDTTPPAAPQGLTVR